MRRFSEQKVAYLSLIALFVVGIGAASSAEFDNPKEKPKEHHEAKPHREQEKKHEPSTTKEHGKEEHHHGVEHKHTEQEKKIVETLHRVAEKLHRADHDYDNQRHDAVHDVCVAIREMHAAEPKLGPKVGGMTQALSDKMLREEIPTLKAVRAELAAKGAPAHHQAAMRELDKAIEKLHIALKIR